MNENVEKKKKRTGIIKVLFLLVIVFWIVCFLIDYTRVRRMEDPMFCINKTTKEYSDGKVYICTGLGYKSYRYERTSINAKIEFGPFFIKERTE